MFERCGRSWRQPWRDLLVWVVTIALCFGLSPSAYGQTASNVALAGVALDPSGSVVPDVVVTLFNQATGEKQSTSSNEEGRFAFFSLLSPLGDSGMRPFFALGLAASAPPPLLHVARFAVTGDPKRAMRR